jgi:hypothetical protein
MKKFLTPLFLVTFSIATISAGDQVNVARKCPCIPLVKSFESWVSANPKMAVALTAIATVVLLKVVNHFNADADVE